MKANNFTPPKYRQYSSRLKEITRWQVIRLKEMGYKNTFISNLLGIHTSTISTWYKKHLKSNDSPTFNQEEILTSKFGKLLPDELKVLSYQAMQLIETDVKRSKIAEMLGLSSGAVVSGWLNKKHQEEQKKISGNKKIVKPKIRNKAKKQENYKKIYKSLTKRMKDIIHWQIIRLKQKGYDTSFISDLLKVNKSLISNYWESYKKESNSTTPLNPETITRKFGTLSVKEKGMLLSQIAYLEDNGRQRSEIANIIGLSSGAVISGWYQEKTISKKAIIKEDKTTNPYDTICKKLSLLGYRSYKQETKKLARWQALYLIKNGHKYSEASAILHIHAGTISKWWKLYLKPEGKKEFKLNSKLNKQFKKLTPEMKRVLLLQMITLKQKGYTNKKIADVLALNNAALVSRWLNKILLTSPTKKPTNITPINLPQIGLTKKPDQLKPNNRTNSVIQTIETPKEPPNLTSKPIINNEQVITNNAYFSENRQDKSIEIKSDVKILKAKDFANYCESEELIEVSKNSLFKSEIKAEEIKANAEKSAEIMTREIIKNANEKAKKEADELLAEKNIAAVDSATEYLSSIQKKLPDIIMTIIGKFIKNYDDRDFVIHTINSAISEINNKEKVKIHVNNKIIDDVKKRLNDINYPDEKITLISDKSLGKKDCLVVTKLGVVNANLESQIKKIEENINATNTI